MELIVAIAVFITIAIAVALIPYILEALIGINKVVGAESAPTTSSFNLAIPDVSNPNTQLILLGLILVILLFICMGVIWYRLSRKQDLHTFL